MITTLTDEEAQNIWEEVKTAGLAAAQGNQRKMGKGGNDGTAEVIIFAAEGFDSPLEGPFVQWLEKKEIGHKRESGVLDGWGFNIDEGLLEDTREGARLAYAEGAASVLRDYGMETTFSSMHG